MRSLSSLAIVPLLALVGCYPFVSGGRFDDRLCELDEDGDGDLKCEDCDDSNPDKYNGATEVPYDGIDNDCDGKDIVDADGDGFAGISRADYEALGGEPWPSGQAEAVDCDDTDGSISPAATEIWYDGTDQDCKGDCDYDQDGDDFADARRGTGNDCGLPATDCLDIRADIYPGAPGEVFYDGEDQDCDGVNDFDPDQDGEAWDGYADENDTFLNRYGYTDSITGYTECYDIDDGNLPEVDPQAPGTVNTGATEIYGDGVDGDCSDLDGTVENDFDADGDGYMPTASRAAFVEYVQRYVDYTKHDGTKPYKAIFESTFGSSTTAWQAYFDAHDNDCDDNDPSVRPGALETLADGVDQDCDGDGDTTPFVFRSFDFEGLGAPELTTTGERFAMLVSATVDADFGSGSEGPKVAALSFPLDATADDAPNKDDTPYAVPSGDNLSLGLGLAGFDGGYFTAFGWERGGNKRTRATLSTAGSTSSSEFSVDDEADSARLAKAAPWDQTDLVCDAATDSCWAVSCNATDLQFLEFSDAATAADFQTLQSGNLAEGGRDCFVVTKAIAGTTLIVRVSGSGGAVAYEASGSGGLTLSETNPFADRMSYAKVHDDVVVIGVDESTPGVRLFRGTGDQRLVLRNYESSSGDAAYDGSVAYVVATDGSTIRFSYGDPASSMTTVDLPFSREGSSLTPEYVAIEVDGDRVAIAAVSSNDDLGWLFFEI